jgi:hypothetical protein
MSSERYPDGVTGWVGWIAFAGYFMIIAGFFGAIQGFAALLRDESYFFVTEDGLLTFNYVTWGWIHLILGVVLMVIGGYLLKGSTWARVVAIILVGLHLIAQFGFVSAYPVWSVVIIAVDLLILYALLVHGREAGV